MKPNDLRVGNWVYDSFLKRNIQIELGQQIDFRCVQYWKPIPLSPKWVLKLSLVKDNYGLFEKYKDNVRRSGIPIELWIKKCMVKHKWVWDISVGHSFGNTHNIAYIKYVHQLQNLYFALKGKEITDK